MTANIELFDSKLNNSTIFQRASMQHLQENKYENTHTPDRLEWVDVEQEARVGSQRPTGLVSRGEHKFSN